MAPLFTVDTDALETQAQSIRSTMERMEGDGNGLVSQLAQFQGSWTGQASAQFHAAAERWRLFQRQVSEELSLLGTALSTAGRHYSDAEQSNAGLFR